MTKSNCRSENMVEMFELSLRRTYELLFEQMCQARRSKVYIKVRHHFPIMLFGSLLLRLPSHYLVDGAAESPLQRLFAAHHVLNLTLT